MNKLLTICFLLFTSLTLYAQPGDYEWSTPSKNSSESMPCGGGDIGMNVWVEQGDILFYLSRSGSFDENNTLLKAGRFRVSLSPGLDMTHFRQILHLADGYVEITDGQLSVQLWADVKKPVVHVDVSSPKVKQNMAVTYENWRMQDREMTKRECFQSSYKFAAPKGLKTLADKVITTNKGVTFLHKNGEETIFDATVTQQDMDAVKDRLYNPLKNLISGGKMQVRDMVLMDSIRGRYASTDYSGWMYVTKFPKRTLHPARPRASGGTNSGSVATSKPPLPRPLRPPRALLPLPPSSAITTSSAICWAVMPLASGPRNSMAACLPSTPNTSTMPTNTASRPISATGVGEFIRRRTSASSIGPC